MVLPRPYMTDSSSLLALSPSHHRRHRHHPHPSPAAATATAPMSTSTTLRLLPLKLAAGAGKTRSFLHLAGADAGKTQPFYRRRLPLFTSTTPISTIAFQRVTSSPTPPPPLPSPAADRPLPEPLRRIVELFQSVEDPRAKYEQLLFYGKKLPPLPPKFKTQANKVQGCVSQVWVHAYLDADGAVRFEADSDSSLTKGLAALLVQGLSGLPPLDIAGMSPEFVQLLGLRQSLTPSRNNGFLNMLRLMQRKALQLYADDSEAGLEEKDSNFVEVDSNSDQLAPNSNFDYQRDEALDMEVEVGGGGLGGRQERIWERLNSELSPVELDVEDISYQHAGHAAVRGSGDGETHFKVKVVSEEFEGKSLVKRHRLVYDLLQDELQSGLHALSIVAKTPEEASVR